MAGALEKEYGGEPFAIDDTRRSENACWPAGTLTLVTDNAGEVVLDRLLLRVLGRWRQARGEANAAGSKWQVVRAAPCSQLLMLWRDTRGWQGLTGEGRPRHPEPAALAYPIYMSREALKKPPESGYDHPLKGLANYERFWRRGFSRGVLPVPLKCEVLSDALESPSAAVNDGARSREGRRECPYA